MKILLTGCDGQVGRSLKKKLVGITELYAFNKKTLDISNQETVSKTVFSVRPNIVINAAAYTAVDNAEENKKLAFKVNKDGPQFLAEAAEEINASIIHISTDYVFDGLSDVGYSETDEVHPQGVYGASKLAGEIALKYACEKHIILRTAWVFSEHGNNFLKTMLHLASERENLDIVNDQVGGPTYAGDIADAILAIIDHNKKSTSNQWGLYHYSGAPHVSWYQFARYIFKNALEKDLLSQIPTLRPILSAEYPTRAIRPKNSRLNCSKIHSHFGINEPDWESSVDSVIDNLKVDN